MNTQVLFFSPYGVRQAITKQDCTPNKTIKVIKQCVMTFLQQSGTLYIESHQVNVPRYVFLSSGVRRLLLWRG